MSTNQIQVSENVDPLADIGTWICANVPALHYYNSPPDWIYNHISLGPGMLPLALRLHWLCTYLFMLNGLVYVLGLVIGGGWRSLLPRRTDLRDATKMFCYYTGIPLAKLTCRTWLHPRFNTKYNALQRVAYFSIPVAALLSVATAWAIHKPMQLYWLAGIFGGYNKARIWHFWLMWVFILFVVPHVTLVLADGWDTLRSMIVRWSATGREWYTYMTMTKSGNGEPLTFDDPGFDMIESLAGLQGGQGWAIRRCRIYCDLGPVGLI